MSEQEPTADDQAREFITEALSSPESLGYLLIMGLEEEADPLSAYEERTFALLDMQARHADALCEDGVLEVAMAEASFLDSKNPGRPLLDPGLIYRACVYRLRGMCNGVPTEIGGIRFITTTMNESGVYREASLDVPVYMNDQYRRGYTSANRDTVMALVGELEANKDGLHLMPQHLTSVIKPRN